MSSDMKCTSYSSEMMQSPSESASYSFHTTFSFGRKFLSALFPLNFALLRLAQ